MPTRTLSYDNYCEVNDWSSLLTKMILGVITSTDGCSYSGAKSGWAGGWDIFGWGTVGYRAPYGADNG